MIGVTGSAESAPLAALERAGPSAPSAEQTPLIPRAGSERMIPHADAAQVARRQAGNLLALGPPLFAMRSQVEFLPH